jgi:hypothetical protein
MKLLKLIGISRILVCISLVGFGPKRDEVKGNLRKLHNEELYNLHSSPNIIRMIKSRSTRLVGYVERIGRRGMHIAFWWESQR